MKYFHYNIISSTSDYAKILLQNKEIIEQKGLENIVENSEIGGKIDKLQHSSQISRNSDFKPENYEIIVTADFQTSGRGRNQNLWVGNYGDNIYLSYGINHSTPINFNQAALYQAIGCLSVLNALKKCFGMNDKTSESNTEKNGQHLQSHIAPSPFKIKYPNDVYAFERSSDFLIQDSGISDKFNIALPSRNSSLNTGYYKKISGILTEHGFLGNNCSYSILGIGINVNQTDFKEELKEKATSLKLLNLSVDINKLINLLIDEINFLKKLNYENIFKLWSTELNIVNKFVSVKKRAGKWIVKKLLPDSRLLIFNTITNEELIIDDGDSVSYEL